MYINGETHMFSSCVKVGFTIIGIRLKSIKTKKKRKGIKEKEKVQGKIR